MYDFQKRRDRIIETIVTAFLETAEPVSSSCVAETCGLSLSPATIRNIMKELEHDGFLTHPHTSAGRIPTVKCYRYYVKHLMTDVDPSDSVLQAARLLVKSVLREHDANEFLDHIANGLSEVTDLIGVAMSPSFERETLDRLEIVNIGGSQFLVIISLRNGIVKTIKMTVNRIIPRTKIDETAQLLTTRLHGLTVAEIKKSIRSRLWGFTGGDRSLFNVILNKHDIIFNFTGDENLHVSGLSRLLNYPEFTPVDHMLKLVDLFEHKSEIVKELSLTVYEDEDVNIHIGNDGLWGPDPSLSLVSATFYSENSRGAIAVIGPARIHYPRLSAIVQYAAQVTAQFYSTC